MQLLEPRCWTRRCVHYIGVKEFIPEDEMSQDHYCEAFLDGIPNEISYGKNLHLKPLKDQRNDIVFEKVKSN